MKRVVLVTAFVLVWILTSVGFESAVTAEPQPSGSTLGNDVVVGIFELEVNVEEQGVEIEAREVEEEDEDSGADRLPITELVAEFIGSDAVSGTASISVAVRNVGTRSLFSPIHAVIVDAEPSMIMALNPDAGAGPGPWRWDYGPSLLGGAALSPSQLSGARLWDFGLTPDEDHEGEFAEEFRLVVQVRAGVPLAAGEGATIQGDAGTSITVQPNSIPYEVLIDVAPAPPSAVVAPLGELALAGAVELTFMPSVFNASLLPPLVPLELSITAPAGTPAGSEFVVGQQALVDSMDGSGPGLKEQPVAVDTASLVGGSIVTHPHVFSGIFGGGLFVFLFQPPDFGFATGVVSDANGIRPGAVVSNSTNTIVSIADATGRYTLPITGGLLGLYTVTGFDPLRGSSGSAVAAIPSTGATVTTNLFLTTLAAPLPTRDGIRNSGFERCDLSSWRTTGAASAVQQLGPTSTGVTIRPTEGQCMADINTGPGAVGGIGSSLKQRLIVPAGVQMLRLDFNFVSEEFPEFVGTIFNDAFRAMVTTPNGQTTFAQVSVNQSGGSTLIGDCFFPGGDSTCGQTGWREGTVNLSAFAGTNTPITVELLFTANDAGDDIFDTHVLVDNIRFATVWVDVKVIQGAISGLGRVQNEVRGANEILSQAGLNVRIRNVQTIADPGGLLDTDITWTTGPACADGRANGRLTVEERHLMGLSRSTIASDANVYYVRSGTGIAGVGGLAIGPDDFCVDVNITTNSGTLQMDAGVGGNILAHELGHLLISPQTAGSVIEHNAPANNFMRSPGTPTQGAITRQQSANINRTGAPLLVP